MAKAKKIILNIFAIAQIVFLVLGSVPAASASWASLRYDIDEDDVPSGIKDEGEYEVAASYKRNDQVPKVSIMFNPVNPKAGEKVTATATTISFANDTENQYYTWFLKRKGCDLKVSEADGSNERDTNSEGYIPDSERNWEYPTHEKLSSTSQECDADEDGLITANDWKVTAGRMIVQNGFQPDITGKYSSRDAFYTEETDSDGYKTWQGGADAERMPIHCYGYDGTSGLMFEYIDQYLKSVPMCPNGEPAVCGKTIQYETDVAVEDFCDCTLDDSPDASDLTGNTDREAACTSCVDQGVIGTLDSGDCEAKPGKVLWYATAPDVAFTANPPQTACHYNCTPTTTHTACRAVSTAPRCQKVAGSDTYAAVCGPDSDEDGLDDNVPPCGGGVTRCSVRSTVPTSRMTAFCPTTVTAYNVGDPAGPFNLSETTFNALVGEGINYSSEKYYSMTGKFDPYEDLPSCNCDLAQRDFSDPRGTDEVPYTGSDDEPLCEDRSPVSKDLVCGSGSTTSIAAKPASQFHLFPKMLPTKSDGRVKTNYYELTREYFNQEQFRHLTNTDTAITGNGKFELAEEKFWGTDPRNPSTAGNGRYDEANLVGLGATEFSWKYQEGDEVGVAVEGTSNIGTKFPDASRMIMWAFSNGVDKATNKQNKGVMDAACQIKYSGTYNIADYSNMQNVGLGIMLPEILQMPTGFMDFDRCIEKSTIPLVAGGGPDGAQPKGMEVELSATPDKPLNDENGEGQGDIVDVQAIVSGAVNPQNDLNYSWKIQVFKPDEINSENLSVAPISSDWDEGKNPPICGKDIDAACPLKGENGGNIKMSGLGTSGINFKLNITPDDPLISTDPNTALYSKLFNEKNGDGYFRVSVEVRESETAAGASNSRVGRGETVIKVNSAGNKINVFRPAVTADSKLASPGVLFCIAGAERNPCLVTKNEIIGLSVSDATKGETLTDFNWFLNGRALNDCDKSMSEDCENNKGAKTTYIPVTGNMGDTFTVSVKANNIAGNKAGDQTGTGKKIELSQQFQIAEPSIRIISADKSKVWPKLIGSFVDPTKDADDAEKYKDDFSESILETAAGNNVKLKLDYIPAYLSDAVSAENWQIDGVVTTDPQFTAGPVGTVHNASASVTYSQSTDIYRMLKEKFGVSVSEMKDQTLSDSIQVEVNKDTSVAILKSPMRFMANLLSKIPEQVLFMLRLMLSVAMVIVLTSTIFAFFPAVVYDERRG